ncbi:MAG: hypothetical protein LBI20_03035 [Holosporales bacterium]|nr:hypothetical protein [Holosporales bacterium]
MTDVKNVGKSRISDIFGFGAIKKFLMRVNQIFKPKVVNIFTNLAAQLMYKQNLNFRNFKKLALY